MHAEDQVLLAELERRRLAAIQTLQNAADAIDHHIAMLEAPIDERSHGIGSEIAQREASQLGFAIVAATQHDLLLLALRGEYSSEQDMRR